MRNGSGYRVFPYDPNARPGTPGHPLFVPSTRFAAGRVDNPDLYRALYMSSTAEGAIGEALAGFPIWDASILIGRGGYARALGRFRFMLGKSSIRDLDEPTVLTEHSLRPSQIATPEREVTQGWARRIFEERRWAGVQWWSVRDARWTSIAIWSIAAVRLAQVEPLTLAHPAFIGAAGALHRPISAVN